MPEDKDSRIAFLEAELARVKGLSIAPTEDATELVYWVNTMRGEQPRCRKCDGPLTRGPQGGFVESECPHCHMELRSTPPMERR